MTDPRARPILVEGFHDFNRIGAPFITIAKGDRVRMKDHEGNSCEALVTTDDERDGRFMFRVLLDQPTWKACGEGGVPEALEVILNFVEACLDGDVDTDYTDDGGLRHAATILRKNQGEAQGGWVER